MPSLTDLNIRSEWVGHEFRVLARNYGWLVKKIGVESLFANRKGVLRYLQSQFTPIGLLLRSQPDLLIKGNNDVIDIFEVKAVEDTWSNVAVEAWQLIYIQTLYKAFQIDTYYIFGWPDTNKLSGVIVPISKLPVMTHFYKTPRFMRWDPKARDLLERLVNRYHPGIDIRVLEVGHGGSGDPYLVFPKSSLSKFESVSDWFQQRGKQIFNMRDRISWEGTRGARVVWKSFRYSEWIDIHEITRRESRQ